MKQDKLSFELENLQVGYLIFNILGFDNTEFIAKYLFEKFNSNSIFAKGQNGKIGGWFYFTKNQYHISFR